MPKDALVSLAITKGISTVSTPFVHMKRSVLDVMLKTGVSKTLEEVEKAIDADLNAGLIKQEEARQRRAEVAQEADFFGSMDGASKFVRGDAIAGILILLINIIGGMISGLPMGLTLVAPKHRDGFLLEVGAALERLLPARVPPRLA